MPVRPIFPIYLKLRDFPDRTCWPGGCRQLLGSSRRQGLRSAEYSVRRQCHVWPRHRNGRKDQPKHSKATASRLRLCLTPRPPRRLRRRRRQTRRHNPKVKRLPNPTTWHQRRQLGTLRTLVHLLPSRPVARVRRPTQAPQARPRIHRLPLARGLARALARTLQREQPALTLRREPPAPTLQRKPPAPTPQRKPPAPTLQRERRAATPKQTLTRPPTF